MPESTLVGSRIGTLELFSTRGVAVVAAAVQTPRIEGSLGDVQLAIGDVLYLRGAREQIEEALDEAELLALMLRPAPPSVERTWLPVGTFAAGVALAASGLAAPEFAFGLVVLVLAAAGIRLLADLGASYERDPDDGSIMISFADGGGLPIDFYDWEQVLSDLTGHLEVPQ